MASTYSTNLAIELIGTGDQAGSWGNTTNTNLGTLIEQAISGYVTQAVSTGTDTTITIPNGATGVARNMYIELTGTGGASTNLIVPANKKLYFIFNNASGAVTVKVSGQTGVSVPAGKKVVLASNGTDAVNALNYIAEFGSNSATITQLTATSATITNLTLTSLVISNLSIASANITTLTSSSATITNLLGTTLTISGNTFLATSSGNVGIGTSSPSVKLHVKGSGELARLETTGATGNNYLNFADASADKAYVGFTSASTETFVVQNIENGAMLFATNNTERARITSGGGFLVGANPTEIGTNSVTTASSGSTANGFACIVSGYAAAFFGINNTASTVRGVPASSFGVGTADGIPLTFATNNTEKMRLDTSGNLGLGVSPSAWGSIFNAMQLGDGGFIAGRSDVFTQLQLGCNGYYDGSNFKFLGTGRAARYYQDGGEHYWETSASGTAGGTISFTQAMTLTSGGNLLVGSSSSVSRLYVKQGSNATFAGGFVLENSSDATRLLNYFDSGADAWVFSATYSSTGAYKPITFKTSDTERARITSDGKVGIGTTSPSSLLTVNGSTTVFRVNGGNTSTNITSGTPDQVLFQTTNSTNNNFFQLQFLDANGNIKINAGVINENHTSNFGAGAFFIEPTIVGTPETFRVNSNGYTYLGYTASNGAYRLQVNGQIFATSATIATSDARYKENIASLNKEDSYKLIKQLNPVRFTWKSQSPVLSKDGLALRPAHVFPEGVHVGFLAQEVQKAVDGNAWSNSLVRLSKRSAVYEDGVEVAPEEEFLGLAETNMIPLLTAALQEAMARIEKLEAEMVALKGA